MAEFSRLVITRKGQELLAKMLAGQGDIKFSKISASSTFYEVEQLEALEELPDVKQTNKISKITRTNEVAVKVETAFSNTELTEGYYMRTLGLYAFDIDGEEILYAVTTETTGNCYMPAYNGVTVSGAYVQLVTTVGNAENVSIKIDQAAIATIGNIQDLQGQIDSLQGKLTEYFGNPDGADNPDGGIGFVEGIEASNVVEAINEVFQLGSEKKAQLAENLAAMGVEASASDTWETLLDKILDITDTSSDTVTAETLLEGYTAHDAAGAQITGIMPERASVTVDTTGVTRDSNYTYFGVPEGHYDENSKVRAINSDLGNRVVKLGSAATYDLKSYPGWENFAINKNIFLTSSTSIRVKRSGNVSNWSFDQSFTSKPSATYTNGILSISSGNGSHIFVESGEAGNVQVWWTNTWDTYLVY